MDGIGDVVFCSNSSLRCVNPEILSKSTRNLRDFKRMRQSVVDGISLSRCDDLCDPSQTAER